jgi:hypothetical protein
LSILVSFFFVRFPPGGNCSVERLLGYVCSMSASLPLGIFGGV